MKKLPVVLAAALTLMPLAALADDTLYGGVGIKAEAHASTTGDHRPLPPLGSTIKKDIRDIHQGIRQVASTTRPNLKGTASTTREDKQEMASTTHDMVKEKLDAIHTLIAKHTDEIKAKADDARQKAKDRFGTKVEKLVGSISDRLSSTSQKLIILADRADARIAQLQAKGHAMTSSLTLLATTRTDITLSQAKIVAVNAALATAVSTTTPKTQLPAVRTAVKAAEAALQTVKDDLQKVLHSIKAEGGADTQAEASTTNTH